jgi:hypothetical protein
MGFYPNEQNSCVGTEVAISRRIHSAGFTYLWALGQTHQWAPKFIEMLALIQYPIYIYITVFFLNGQMSTNIILIS